MNALNRTYGLAWSAGADAANRHCREAGRNHWNGEDYAEAVKVFNEIIKKDVDNSQ